VKAERVVVSVEEQADQLLGDPSSDVPTTRPVFIAFDVLYARGRDLRAQPLEQRRDVLERLVEGTHLVFPVRRLSGDGRKAWEEVLARGIEGYVGRDPASTYLSGGPTRSWLKAKGRHEGRFIVGGVVKRTEGWSLLPGTIQNGGLEQRR
jgi:bifunctional non-homologous end joining protein LigD